MANNSLWFSIAKNRLNPNESFPVTLVIPCAVFVFEAFYGFLLENLIILVCALRTLAHLISIISEKIQEHFNRKEASANYPLGYGKLSSLFDFSMGFTFLTLCFIGAYFSIKQILFPQASPTNLLLEIILLDIGANFISLHLLQKGIGKKKNITGHLISNAIISTILLLITLSIFWTQQLYFLSGIAGLIICGVVTRWSIGSLWISSQLLVDASPNKNLHKKIRTDLYNKFDTIVAVEKIQTWQLNEQKNAAIIRLKLYPGEIYEYRFLKREITKRVQRKYQIDMVAIEFDW